ncbi:MAG: lipopolysaccharide transport periplasmic protein LptA [Rhodanobacteraceae bacterium]
MQADRDQPVNVNANSFSGSQDSGKTVFTGAVKIDQGTLHADGDNANGYFDQNNQVQRVVLTGKPAHMQQKLDDGSMVHGSADTIDYTVSENTVVLIGNANVVQEHKGEFHGAKLTYNTDSGQISGESGGGGQVHLTLQPKPKSAAAKPKTTATQPAPAQNAATQPAPMPSPASSTN